MIQKLLYRINKALCCYLRPSVTTEEFENSTDARNNDLNINDLYHVNEDDINYLALVGDTVCPPIAPPASAVGDVICGPNIPNAFVTGGLNGFYRWYLTPTGGNFLPGEYNQSLENYLVTETTTFYVGLSNEAPAPDNCVSERIPVTVTVNPTDAIHIDLLEGTLCPLIESTLGYSKDPGTNTYDTFIWTASPHLGSGIPEEGITTTDEFIVITPTIPGTYTITLYAQDTIGVDNCAALTTYELVVKEMPTINNISTFDSVCYNQFIDVSADVTGAVSAQWYLDNVLVSSSLTDTIQITTVNPTTELVLVVYGENGCGNIHLQTIDVLPLPEAPIGLDSEHCGWQIPTCIVSTGGINGTGVFNWYDEVTGGNLLQTGTDVSYLTEIDVSTTFYVSEVGANGCESERTPVTVTVIEADPLTLTEDDDTLVKTLGATFNFTINQSGGNNTYKYTLYATPELNSGIVNGTYIDDATQFSVTPTEPGTYTIRVVGYDSDKDCYAMAEITITVEGDPLIFRMKVSEDEDILNFDETKLDINNNTLNITLLVKDTILNEVRIYGYNYMIFNAELEYGLHSIATILELELPTVTAILGDNNGNILDGDSAINPIQKAILPSLPHFNYNYILRQCYAMNLLDIRGLNTPLLNNVLTKIKDNIPNAFNGFTLIIPSDRASDLEVGNIQSLGATITTV